MSENVKKAYRIPPCPDYDVEGMESWLTDMAAEGYVLAEDGYFAGVATFEKTRPQKLKYRLEAAQKNTSMWADDGGEPDPEAVEMSELFGWKYITKRGNFYIYCSADPSARELNTDPQVQAIALDYVRKKRRESIMSTIFWMLIYPLIGIRGSLLLFSINAGSWFMLLFLALTIWSIVRSVYRTVHLGKMQRSLLETGTIPQGRPWKEKQWSYYTVNTVRIVLVIALCFAAITIIAREATDEDRIPLADFSGDMPFATIADFAPKGEYELENWGFSNTVRMWKDWLSPCSVDWNELAHVELSDGTTLEGGLYVDYNELPSDWMAAWAAREYWLSDLNKNEESLDMPELDMEYAVGYSDGIFPTVILQKDNKVIHAYFYQTSDNYKMPFDQWVTLLAESIE